MRLRRSVRSLFVATALGALIASVPAGVLAQASPVPAASGVVTGSATPEAAVEAYVAALAAGDAERILAASAVDRMADGFDFQAYTERIQALTLMSMAPAEYPLFRSLNRYQQAAQLLGQVRNLVYGLLSGETIDGSAIAPMDALRITAFMVAVDPARLTGLSTLDVRMPEPEAMTSDRYLELAAALAKAYGADEMTERLALVELDGQTYALGFTLLRYGHDWLVSNQSSPIGGTSLLGTAEPMSRADFEARTGG